ncbi:hypothetical protein ECC02_008934 [Trypanosoma cruzi]|uniref:Uncharacterized protein n=1 Tax=Trypanosoma cruzi TaxID=5693 RepID=A0A7J6XVY6_TRYCR|nr:hypothetical protein ECC02_008934 [Trypanosoma cruzi]
MFGRRSMARTTDVCVGGRDVHCGEKEKKWLRDDHHQTRVKLCFVHLREGGLPPGRLGGLFFLRRCALFIFRCAFMRTCEGRFARNSCEASVPPSEKRIPLEKRCLLNLFWAGGFCRFNATLLCVFDACVSERFDQCSQPTQMWCARRREVACRPFYCLPRCGCRRCLPLFLRSCGLLTRCFGEGVAALIVHGILILVSRSGDIEREGFCPFVLFVLSA